MTHKEEYHVKNNTINNINKTINNHISEYERKFTKFIFNCRIDSTIEKYNKSIKVNLYITFYSKKKAVSHTYYPQCPKPMIENQMLNFLDANPLLIKSLVAYLELIPLIDRIIYKYWGRIVVNKKKELVLDRSWYESPPQQPSQELLELMRSY